MQHRRPRENRKSVRISVRVRTDDGWVDATVRNVSTRGMMLHSLRPLRRNEFIEVSRGRYRIVGRIVWSQGAGCGMRTQDQVDIAGLLGQSSAPTAGIGKRQGARVSARPAVVRTIDEQAQASRVLGQRFEQIVILIVGAAVSMLAASSAYEALASPLHEVEVALAAGPR